MLVSDIVEAPSKNVSAHTYDGIREDIATARRLATKHKLFPRGYSIHRFIVAVNGTVIPERVMRQCGVHLSAVTAISENQLVPLDFREAAERIKASMGISITINDIGVTRCADRRVGEDYQYFTYTINLYPSDV